MIWHFQFNKMIHGVFVSSVHVQLSKKYNMVIVSPILERDETHGDILANTAGMYMAHVHGTWRNTMHM